MCNKNVVDKVNFVMPNLQLSISYQTIIIIFSFFISIAIAIYIYRFTVPAISKKVKSILIVLRSVALFLLILLLGEPLLLLVTHSTSLPIVAVLIDNSKSMSIKDKNIKRSETIKEVLKSSAWEEINRKGKIRFFKFDSKLRPIIELKIDSLTQNGETTDIAEALRVTKKEFEGSNLQSVVIISDGNSTVGENPIYEAEELGLPIFTIGIGDTSEQQDLLIRKIICNEIAYTGTKAPINITVRSVGYGGERVQISLSNGASMIDEKTLLLENGSRDYNVPLFFLPEKEGLHKLTVSVSTLAGELTAQNNKMSCFIKVLKSKLRVLLIAGAPSPDVAVIRRMLEENKNFEVKTYIERNNGQFYGGNLPAQSMKETDCVILIGFPTNNSSLLTMQMVLDAVDMHKPIMIILSRNIDYNKLKLLNSVLPFTIENTSALENQIFVEIIEAQSNHSIIKIGDTFNTVETWSKLPPIFRLQGIYRSKIESQILATTRMQSVKTSEPLIVANNALNKKSVAILGYGIWRWNMLSEEISGSQLVLANFLNNSLRWLTTIEDSRRVRVQPVKPIFTTQDAVEFIAQVYDENFQPIDNAQIEIKAQRHNDVSMLSLNSLGSGQYYNAYEQLSEGEYKYTATVMADGREIGTDQGVFSIGGLNVEFIETRMNKSLLRQIALQSGGKYYNSEEVNKIVADISSLPNFISQETTKSSEIEIWNSRWMILLIILLFALEWFLRKRYGLL